MSNREEYLDGIGEEIQEESGGGSVVQHQNPADKLVRKSHSFHDSNKIVKKYSIIGFEHVESSHVRRNIVSIDVINRAADICDTKQNILVLNRTKLTTGDNFRHNWVKKLHKTFAQDFIVTVEQSYRSEFKNCRYSINLACEPCSTMPVRLNQLDSIKLALQNLEEILTNNLPSSLVELVR